MSHVFLAVNGDNVGESIGNAIISDNHDELTRVSGSIKAAHQMLDQWVQAKGGKVVISSGDEGIYQVPADAANELDIIKQKYAKMANTSITIGVGSTMSEASKALIYGKMNNKDQVVHYEPAIDDYISEDPEAQQQENDFEQQAGDEGQEENQEGDLPNPDDVTDEGNDADLQAQGGDEAEQEDTNEISDEEGNQSKQQNAAIEDGTEDPEADAGQTGSNPAPKAPGAGAAPKQKNQPFGKQPNSPAPTEDNETVNTEEDAEPTHEEGMDPEQEMAHDAQENEDDEADADDIEADKEQEVFGAQSQPDNAGTEELEDASGEDAALDQGDGDPDENNNGVGDDEDAEFQADGDASDDSDPNLDDEDGLGSFGDDNIQELGDDEVEGGAADQAMDPNEQEGVLSEMMHANQGDEESEDSDDEIKADIIESLMAFKTHKQNLEELKQTNPELYQANVIMLRTMIQMAKKLQMNPERGVAEATMSQDAQAAFPQAEDEEDQLDADPMDTSKNPLLGKSENIKGVHKPSMTVPGKSKAGLATGSARALANHPKDSVGGKARVNSKEIAIGEHKKVLGELKAQPKPNLPKSEAVMNKARVDEGKTDNQKQVARAGRNSRVKFAAGSPAGQHPDTGEHVRARKPGEGDKIIGIQKKPNMKAPTHMNKSKAEDVKVDIKKNPVKKR